MSEASLIFPAAEFRDRVARIQEEMEMAELDALLLTTASDIFYATGFLTRFWESPARPWFILVPARGAPVSVIPSIGAALMARTWIDDIRTWDAPDPDDDGVTLLSDTIAQMVPRQGALGVPMGLETHLRMPIADYHRIRDAIAPRRIVDATAVVQRTREIKSPAEIGKLRDICAIAGRVFDRFGDFARIGRPLEAVFRDFQAELLREGADWVSYVAGAAGPGGYEDVISPATSRPIADGDVLMLDTGAVKDGYFCDFDRNAFFGRLPDAVARVQDVLWQVTEDALSAIRPGMRACDVHQMLWDGIRDLNAQPCGGRFGHGLGINLTEWPSFTPLDETELRAGMVLTLEPSAYTTGDRFLVHEENIVLHETGAELLSPRATRGGVILPA